MVVRHIPEAAADAAFRAGPHPSCAASIAAARLPAEVDPPTRRAGQRHSGAPAHHSDHQGGNPAMGAAQTREYVDKRYEDRDLNELPDAPVEALRGLGKRGGEALHKAFGVKTIRELATNDFVLKAQEVLRLAEGPTAIPTAAPAAAAAGVDAADHRRTQARQQAPTRPQEGL